MSVRKEKFPVVLCVLDGWGHAKASQKNAISEACTPTWDRWCKAYPHILLEASGEAVGLPQGQIGNSEVGHMTIGSGRIVLQDLPRINEAFKNGFVETKQPIKELLNQIKDTQKTCHMMGLFSSGGVHSHVTHIVEFIKIFGRAHLPVCLHLFLDGRDTPPQSAQSFFSYLAPFLKKYPTVKIATVMGRFYGMDRDCRWERTEAAYHAIVCGEGRVLKDPAEILQEAYSCGTTDEFVPPIVIKGYLGMQEGDALLSINFRADRMRQILLALLEHSFNAFKRKRFIPFSQTIGMKEYSEVLSQYMHVLFPQRALKKTLGAVLSQHGLHQLRIAETEKYAHVTFFFNGGDEKELPYETRCLVPSPKVRTYDEMPQMSAHEITATVVDILKKRDVDVVIMNFANADMVGHSGKMNPTIKAVETIDDCLASIEQAVLEKNGILFVTADHGNAEIMEDPLTHDPHTAHTTSLVPFIAITKTPYQVVQATGGLQDVAPTVLSFIGIEQPKEMTGRALLKKQ